MQTKIRLGFYMYTIGVGGAEQYLRDLIWSLDRERFEITLFYEPWKPFEQFLGLDSCPPIRCCPIPVYDQGMFWRDPSLPRPKKNPLSWILERTVRNYFLLKQAFTAAPVDILHINNGGYPGSWTAQMASIVAHSSGIPICLMTIASTPQGMRFPFSKRLEQWLDHLVEQSVDQFITVANFPHHTLQQERKFSPDKIRTIYYGIHCPVDHSKNMDKTTIHQLFGLLPNKIVIGMASRLVQGKGHIYLFEALSRLRDRNCQQVQAFIMGGGPLLDELKEQSRRLGLSDVVIFTGQLSNQEVLQCMRVCDMITLPSEIEGLPYTISEAMSLGKPVVATSVGGIPEQIIQGETGMLVPPRDPIALSEALYALITNPERMRQMGAKALQRYHALFTFGRMLQEHEKLYFSLWEDYRGVI